MDVARRNLLVHATTSVGVAGLGAACWPFIASWQPSEAARALGVPVAVDCSTIAPGQMRVVVWRRKPIYIVRRTAAMLALMGGHDAALKDPDSTDSQQPAYADNPLRSRAPSLFVAIGVCTHLGCIPRARFEAGGPRMGEQWPGGFLCPCHGSRYDLAGRVFKGSPAPTNLEIPPYSMAGPDQLVVG
nr:ubiquinol-cytochrome c reductase iron-sulfur subunit [Gammaproteobacteria bacterium]